MILQEQADAIVHNAVKRHEQLVTVCAWCPDAREKTKQAHVRGQIVTHGICPSCRLLFEEGK